MAAKVIQNEADDGPWRGFKGSRHARAINFVETQCRTPTGVRAGQLIQLADFQKEWLEETLAPDVHISVESIPRGNGKSTFKACLGLWNAFDGDDYGDPQVPVIATTVKQAMKAIWSPAKRMIGMNPELAIRSKCLDSPSNPAIVTNINGEMFPLADAPDGLQGLNPSLALIDEIGFQNWDSYSSLTLALGKRDDGLVVAIGTPGRDMNNALWIVRQSHADGDKTVHYVEWSADAGCDIKDESQWRKANPAYVAGFKSRFAFEQALAGPESDFRIFQLGQWVMGTECWLGIDGLKVWGNLRDPWEFEPHAPTWVAVDAARTRDNAAVVAIQKRPDGRLHAKARIWSPKDFLSGVIDGEVIKAHIRTLQRDFDVIGCGYDPKFFEEKATALTDEGIEMIEFPQSPQRMVPAVGDTYELINKGGLSHDGDQQFQSHILNAVPQYHTDTGFALKKKSPESPDKIDAAVALAMAVKVSQMAAPVEFFLI